MGFIVFLLVCIVVWLISRSAAARERHDALARRVQDIEVELQLIRQEKRTAGAPAPAPTPASTSQEDESRYAPKPLEPVFKSTEPPVSPVLPPPIPTPAPEPSAPVSPTTPPPLPSFAKAVEPPTGTSTFGMAAESEPVASEVPPALTAAAGPEPQTETPKESVPPPQPEKGSFEMRLGTFWAVRVGAVMFLTGLVFLGYLSFSKIGPGGKVSLLYLASATLLGLGAWWQRKTEKPAMRNYAQVLFAGGLAAVYFTTYAAHHIPQLAIISSALIDGTLLLAWAGFMAWIADRRRSEVLAFFAVALAYYTSAITHEVGAFTLYSNLLLTVIAVVFLVRHRWAGLSFASLVATYAGYGFWRFFGDGGWHWATPGEGLWFGASFLACYWACFTAATFLSKAKRLSGSTRSLFLTMNNGAFFALFLLTMLQVDTGGFWKFSLIYGATLLILSGLARTILPEEPLAKNSYLTQGLLLVTLGLITKFSGMNLALILAVESVTLYVLGSQCKSLVLQTGGCLAAVLATGWSFSSIQQFDPGGVWVGMGLGALMLVNAVQARRKFPEVSADSFHVEPAFFSALALVVWAFTTWQNTRPFEFGLVMSGEALLLALSMFLLRVPELAMLGQLYLLLVPVAWPYDPSNEIAHWTALLLGVHCLVALQLGRRTMVFKAAAVVSSLLSVAWCLAGLDHFDSAGMYTGIVLATMMLAYAYLTHRRSADTDPNALRPGPTYFGALTIAIAIATTWFNTSQAGFPVALAVEAAALTFSIYLLRVREITLLAQLLLLLAQGIWLARATGLLPATPTWQHLVIIGISLGLSHWWQRQKFLAVGAPVRSLWPALYALAIVGVLYFWLHKNASDSQWLALTAVLAVGTTAYGVFTRSWWLAAAGQIFMFISAGIFVLQMADQQPPLLLPLVPIAALGMLAIGTTTWFARHPDNDSQARAPLLMLAQLYRWVAVTMSIWWVCKFVPVRENIWVLMGLGFLEFLLVGWKRDREVLLFSAAFTAAGLVILWLQPRGEPVVYLPNLLAILALLAQQQIARRVPERFPIPPIVHTGVIVTGCLSLLWFLSRWVMQEGSGFYLTMAWAALALVLLVSGVALRERMYRWMGLGILAGSLGRVVLFDVWKQETIYRVLTFMALGVVLLALGFVYNKYQETIRKWL